MVRLEQSSVDINSLFQRSHSIPTWVPPLLLFHTMLFLLSYSPNSFAQLWTCSLCDALGPPDLGLVLVLEPCFSLLDASLACLTIQLTVGNPTHNISLLARTCSRTTGIWDPRPEGATHFHSVLTLGQIYHYTELNGAIVIGRREEIRSLEDWRPHFGAGPWCTGAVSIHIAGRLDVPSSQTCKSLGAVVCSGEVVANWHVCASSKQPIVAQLLLLSWKHKLNNAWYSHFQKK